MKSYLGYILLLLFPATLFAQNLSGVWEGSSGMGTVQLVMIQQGDSCFGYIYENSIGSCTAHFEGRFDSVRKKLKGVSPGFIKKSFGHGLARYSFTYDNTGQREKLSGNATAKSVAAKIMSFGMPVHCVLYRTDTTPTDTTAFMTTRLSRYAAPLTASSPLLNSPIVPDSLSKPMERREMGNVQTISTVEGVLQCTIYDNGVYDHDTVTVFYNNMIIINRAEVSSKPLAFTISVSKQQPVHELIFYANNLGEIPPNTGLLLIEAGGKRSSIPIKADLSTNGKVIIKLIE